MKARHPLLFFFLFFLSLAFCNPCFASPFLSGTDMAGRRIHILRPPDRILALGPGALRLIIYLQAQDKIVGVEDMEKQFPSTRPYWIAWGKKLEKLPSAGPGGPAAINREPDLEKILAVKPDMIFITYLDRDKADILQKKTGIPVVVLTYGPFGTFDEKVYDSLRLCGQLLQRRERSEAIIRFMEKARKDFSTRIRNIPDSAKPSVYVGGIGFRGTQGIESTDTDYLPFEWLRVQNIAKQDGRKGRIFVDREKILRWNPDIIFLDAGGRHLISRDYARNAPFYQGLRSFQNRKVYLLHPFNWYVTNLETVIADAYAAGKIIYPRHFQDVSLDKKSDEIYTFFLGKPISRTLEKAHGKNGSVPLYLK